MNEINCGWRSNRVRWVVVAGEVEKVGGDDDDGGGGDDDDDDGRRG